LRAETAKHVEHRESWLRLAAQWQRLALETERDGQQAQQPQPEPES
jgi:hypothetical protein